MTTEQLLAKIEKMSHEEMARLWRFEPVGSPYFLGEVGKAFQKKFDSLGGFTPEISKKIDK